MDPTDRVGTVITQGSQAQPTIADLPDHIQKMIIKSSGLSANALASTSRGFREKASGFLAEAALKRKIVCRMLDISENFPRWQKSSKCAEVAKAIGIITLHEPQRVQNYLRSQYNEYLARLNRAMAEAKFSADFAGNKEILPTLWNFQNPREFFPTFQLVAKYDLECAVIKLCEFVDRLDDILDRDEVLLASLKSVISIDHERAVQIAEKIESESFRIDAYASIIKKTASTSPAVARSVLEKAEKLLLADRPDYEVLRERVILANAVFHLDPGRAFDLLHEIEKEISTLETDSDYKNCLYALLAKVLAAHDPERSLQPFNSIEDSDIEGECSIKSMPIIAGPGSRWDIALKTALGLDAWQRASALIGICKADLSYAKSWREELTSILKNQSFGIENPGEVSLKDYPDFFERALQMAKAREKKRKEFVRSFTSIDQAIVALTERAVLDFLKEDPERGAFLLSDFLPVLAKTNLERAMELLQHIHNDSVKVKALMNIYRKVVKNSPGEASLILKRAESLASSIEDSTRQFEALHTIVHDLELS